MKPLLSRLRVVLVGSGLVFGMALPASAGPAGYVAPPSVPAALTMSDQIGLLPAVMTDDIDVDIVEVGRRGKYYRKSRRNRHHHHHHYRRSIGPSIFFGLGIPAYRYIDPYVYVAPPRRVYRTYGLSRAHIAWCEDRYRSYRVWDNTFKPYHGPRRQCRSPFG